MVMRIQIVILMIGMTVLTAMMIIGLMTCNPNTLQLTNILLIFDHLDMVWLLGIMMNVVMMTLTINMLMVMVITI